MNSIKSATRKLRKALRRIGHGFPKRGAFHIRLNGIVVSPDHILYGTVYQINAGPVPTVTAAPPAPVPVLAAREVLSPTLAVPTCYKRTERISKDGEATKKRVDYRAVKNPKSGESYFVRREVNGKSRYVEVAYSSLLNTAEAA